MFYNQYNYQLTNITGRITTYVRVVELRKGLFFLTRGPAKKKLYLYYIYTQSLSVCAVREDKQTDKEKSVHNLYSGFKQQLRYLMLNCFRVNLQHCHIRSHHSPSC